MKKIFLIPILYIIGFSVNAQNLHLKIEGNSSIETQLIDSLGYQKKHENTKSILDENNKLLSTLLKNGFLESTITNQQKTNDSTFLFQYSLGQKTKNIHIYIGNLSNNEKQILNLTSDTIKLNLNEVENFMNLNLMKLESKGYSLSELQLVNHHKSKNKLFASLKLSSEKPRILNDIVIVGYPKFPEGIRRNIAKQFRKKTFNQQNLKELNSNFKNLPFVNTVKSPEILFTTDSTKAFVYLEKSKANRFDGFIGFSNDENSGIRFNGYLDLLLLNSLNSGEKLNLYWKSDGKKQTTFNLNAELPYLFKSSIGIKGGLRIFKQDSTFQNTTTDINLGYYFSYNSKLFLGYQSSESVDIQNTNNASISDFSNTFWNTSYEFSEFLFDDFLFPEKTYVNAKFGFGNRKSKIHNDNQFHIQTNASHNFYLNKKNIIALKNQNYYLKSSNYIINELYRFGGINSIRGFAENSLQANFFTGIMAEYRYILSPGMYLHTITDYGYFKDESSKLNDNLLGLGFGFGILTKNGLLNLIYANGSTKDQNIKLSNSIVHISFKALF